MSNLKIHFWDNNHFNILLYKCSRHMSKFVNVFSKRDNTLKIHQVNGLKGVSIETIITPPHLLQLTKGFKSHFWAEIKRMNCFHPSKHFLICFISYQWQDKKANMTGNSTEYSRLFWGSCFPQRCTHKLTMWCWKGFSLNLLLKVWTNDQM